jgi:hypothetical protein
VDYLFIENIHIEKNKKTHKITGMNQTEIMDSRTIVLLIYIFFLVNIMNDKEIVIKCN